MTRLSPQIRSLPLARSGFTLLEVIVSVSIIIILVGLSIYGLSGARKAARKAETVARLNSISIALSAYESDHKRMPSSYVMGTNGLQGSQMLTQALIGWMYSKFDGSGTNSATNPATLPSESSDYGFRVGVQGRGKIYGPYLQPDPKTFYASPTSIASGIGYTNASAVVGNTFIDSKGYSILYYKAVPNVWAPTRAVRTTSITRLFSSSSAALVDVDNSQAAFNAFSAIFQGANNTTWWRNDGTSGTLPDVADVSAATEEKQDLFRKYLGSANGDNTIDSGEVILGKDSYLLVAPGEDGVYFTGDDIVSGLK